MLSSRNEDLTAFDTATEWYDWELQVDFVFTHRQICYAVLFTFYTIHGQRSLTELSFKWGNLTSTFRNLTYLPVIIYVLADVKQIDRLTDGQTTQRSQSKNEYTYQRKSCTTTAAIARLFSWPMPIPLLRNALWKRISLGRRVLRT